MYTKSMTLFDGKLVSFETFGEQFQEITIIITLCDSDTLIHVSLDKQCDIN